MLSELQIDEQARLKTLSKGTKEKVQLILVMSRDDLEFEQAAELRDRIRALRARLIALPE